MLRSSLLPSRVHMHSMLLDTLNYLTNATHERLQSSHHKNHPELGNLHCVLQNSKLLNVALAYFLPLFTPLILCLILSVCLQSIHANKVVLNLATRPLHRLLQNSNLPNITQVNAQLEAPYVNRATKLYLYYPQAWWIQAGLNNGSLQYVDRTWPPVNVPIIGR